MDDKDLDKIRGVVREVVKEEIDTAIKPITQKLDALWDQTAKLTVDTSEIQEKQEDHSVSFKRLGINTEHINEDIKKLDRRLTEVEDKNGIVPPAELATNS